jgi:hypothetical protein
MAMSAFTSTAGIYPDGEKVRFVPNPDMADDFALTKSRPEAASRSLR